MFTTPSKCAASIWRERLAWIIAHLAWLCLTVGILSAAEPELKEVAALPAEEAHQAVAVDAGHFYAIANSTIGKYDLRTGKRIAHWDSNEAVRLKHLNSGVVHEGRLYCAHSNWPQFPRNSIEIWDAAKLEHIDRKSFDEDQGAELDRPPRRPLVWRLRPLFAQGGYTSTRACQPNPAGEVRRRLAAGADLVFPHRGLETLRAFQQFGGSFAADGLLYCTGHDLGELYVLGIPEAGKLLELTTVLPAPIEGQGIAWRHQAEAQLFGIRRSRREVVQMEFAR